MQPTETDPEPKQTTPSDQPAAAKPAISARKLEANRRNSKLSCGPRTIAGKAASRFGNLRTGLYAKEIILPGESAEELAAEVEYWTNEYGAVTSAERTEIRNAVYALWRQWRAQRSEAADLTETINDVSENFAERQEEELEGYIAELEERRGWATRGLRNSSLGIKWLLGEFSVCTEQLRRFKALTKSQFHRALCLLNLRAADVLTVGAVRDLASATLAGRFGNKDVELEKVVAFLVYHPEHMPQWEYEREIKRLVDSLPDQQAGQRKAQALVAEVVDGLKERLELVSAREERDRMIAAQKAEYDNSAAGTRRLNGEMQFDRARQRALKLFLKLRAERRAGLNDPDVDPESGKSEESGVRTEETGAAVAPRTAATAAPAVDAAAGPSPEEQAGDNFPKSEQAGGGLGGVTGAPVLGTSEGPGLRGLSPSHPSSAPAVDAAAGPSPESARVTVECEPLPLDFPSTEPTASGENPKSEARNPKQGLSSFSPHPPLSTHYGFPASEPIVESAPARAATGPSPESAPAAAECAPQTPDFRSTEPTGNLAPASVAAGPNPESARVAVECEPLPLDFRSTEPTGNLAPASVAAGPNPQAASVPPESAPLPPVFQRTEPTADILNKPRPRAPDPAGDDCEDVHWCR